ncbi:MAG: phosphopantothenate/pantothenate synthetase [Thermoplasmata archaeon]|nr:phosphopantothenate/pantothenate synthetase [Thermoplasmata archaeon]
MHLSPRHPRYRSLVTRARLAEWSQKGLVVPEGLIAHGRGEAFDYLLGERTTPSARKATRVAAQWLRAARRPVLSVNGNVAALAAPEIARLQHALPSLGVEVNLFHRTPRRAALVARTLHGAGVRTVLGIRPTAKIPGLPSDRAFVDRRGIFVADVCLIPLEDGDRTEALRALGKRVISVDLNPLSRTSEHADLPIVDELVRALHNLSVDLEMRHGTPVPGRFAPFNAPAALRTARATIRYRLQREAAPRSRRAPPRR